MFLKPVNNPYLMYVVGFASHSVVIRNASLNLNFYLFVLQKHHLVLWNALLQLILVRNSNKDLMLAAVGCVMGNLGSIVPQLRTVMVVGIDLHNTHISLAEEMMIENEYIYFHQLI